MENSFTYTSRQARALEHRFIGTIRRYVPKGERLVIGYSGGPDSEAMLQLFLSTSLIHEYELHLLHVDHGWRIESRKEALDLQKRSQKAGLYFHLETLDPKQAEGNLENWSRTCRMNFLKKIGAEIGSNWLLLGHQQDDSIEVTLKRILEGSHLVHVRGMDECVVRDNMNVLRPLLGVLKEDLLAYLRFKNVSWYEDQTNTNTQFLRASMRHLLFPMLSDTLKKNVRSSLGYIAQEAELLHAHVVQSLKEQCSFVQMDRAVLCTVKRPDVSLFLLMQAVHQATICLGGTFSREQEYLIAQVMVTKGRPAFFSRGGLCAYVDGRSFIIVRGMSFLDIPEDYVVMKEGEYQIGSWLIQIMRKEGTLPTTLFMDAFSEGFCFELPSLPVRFIPATEANIRRYHGLYCKELLLLPAALRKYVPLAVYPNKLKNWNLPRSRFEVQDPRTSFGYTQGDGDGLVARDVGEGKADSSTCLGICNQELLASPGSYMIRFRHI